MTQTLAPEAPVVGPVAVAPRNWKGAIVMAVVAQIGRFKERGAFASCDDGIDPEMFGESDVRTHLRVLHGPKNR